MILTAKSVILLSAMTIIVLIYMYHELDNQLLIGSIELTQSIESSVPVPCKTNEKTGIESYGVIVTDCKMFAWSILLTLNVFKVDSFDNKTYPMHIFWVERGANYDHFMRDNNSNIFMKQLKHMIYENFSTLNANNLDIKFLLQNKLIHIPPKYIQYASKPKLPYPEGWKIAFNKLLFFDKEHQFKHYKSILLLDIDMMFIKSIKHLFKESNDNNIDFMMATVKYRKISLERGALGLNGGITLIKPNKTIFHRILEIQKHSLNMNDMKLLDEIYVTSEQTFYEYLFFGPKKQRNGKLLFNISNVKLLPTFYNEIIKLCTERTHFEDVISWHFTHGPKAWNMYIYDSVLKQTKLKPDHWYTKRFKTQFFNQTYDNNSYATMTNEHCKFVVREKWNHDWYNKYYKKLESINNRCYQIRNSFFD